jgi:hypothetical protein
MSSSTSASRQRIAIVATVGLLVTAVEVCVRLAAVHLFLDAAHLHEIPRIAQRMARGAHPRFLFLGNSLTRASVDLETWQQEAARLGFGPGMADKVMPDSTAMLEWYYVFLNNFCDDGMTPDYVVLSFPWESQLWDRPIDAARLGALYCGLANVPELFSEDLPTLDERMAFLAGHVFLLHGDREKIQSRIGAALIPGYKEGIAELNDLRRTIVRSADAPTHQATPPPGHSAFDRLARLCRQRGAKVIVVALPQPARHEMSSEVPRVLLTQRVTLLDARDIPGITPEDFPDGYHVGGRGARLYMSWLAARVAELRTAPGLLGKDQ